jgi:hypothetical protein
MLPVPLLIVIVICGTVLTYMLFESCYVSIRNIKNHMNKTKTPLIMCDENTLNRMDNTSDIL